MYKIQNSEFRIQNSDDLHSGYWILATGFLEN